MKKKINDWPNPKIPYQFEVFGHTIRVNFVDTLVDRDEAQGMAYYREDRIEIQRFNTPAYGETPPEVNETTFFHELVHFILFFMNKNAVIKTDEAFVHRFALSLHQALKTAKYYGSGE